MENGFTIHSDGMSVKYFIGESLADPVLGDHCHDKYEITYLISSSVRYIVEGSEHNVSHGSLALINPMAYHKVLSDSEESLEGYTVYFNKSVLPENIAVILDSLSSDADIHGLFYSHRVLSDALVSVFDRFSETKRLGKPDRQLYLQALISELIILLRAAEGERIANENSDLGARVARYLNTNFRKDICLDKLARRFFVSKYHLCRAFKMHSGISVHAYINHKRITYAKMLIDSGLTASGAAERVGFGDYSAFYRAYVKIVGKSPTAD